MKEKQYNIKQACFTFLLAIFLPSVVVTVWQYLAMALNLIIKVPTLNGYKFEYASNASGNVYYYVAMFLMQATLFLIFFLISKLAKVNIKKENKINAKINYQQIILIVTCGLVAMLSFSPFVNLIEASLKVAGYGVGQSFGGIDLSSFGMLLINILIVGILPAICEELIFRGIILNGLNKYNKYVQILLSALLFMIMHMSVEQSIYQFALGIIFAVIVLKTGSILASMILHAVNNVVIICVNYGYVQNGISVGTSEYVFSAWNIIYPILLVIFGVAVVVGILFVLSKITKRVNESKDVNQSNESLEISADNVTTQSNLLDKGILSNKFCLILTISVSVAVWLMNFILGFYK